MERIQKRIPTDINLQKLFYKQAVCGRDTKIEKGLLDDRK